MNRHQALHRLHPVLAAVALLVLAAAPSPAAGETFTGTIVDAGGSIPGATSAHFTIQIDEYSTDDEVRELLGVLKEQGPEGLEKALFKVEKGWIRIGTSLGYPLSVTRSLEGDGVRVIRVATDRPIQMFEVWRGLRSLDHPFGFAEIRLDGQGKGEGQLIAAASIEFNEQGALEIESLGVKPFRLLNVKQKQKKEKK